MSARETRVAVADEEQLAEATEHPVREELRRIASDTAYVYKLARGKVELPPATPADGPDPYGNPDPEWLRIDWSKHRHQIDVVGAKVNYVEMGEGPPLLFIHGLSGAWQNFLENIPHFARTHRVVALDLPGFGSSPMPPWEVSVPAYGRVVRDFCERLGIGRCSLVGHSMGGFIATEVAITDPERVDDLTLISAAGITRARAPGGGPLRGRPPPRAGGGARASGTRRNAALLEVPHGGHQAPSHAHGLLPGRLLRPRRAPAGDALGERRPRPEQPRLLRRDDHPLGLRHPRPAGGDRGSDAGRLGAQRPRRPHSRRPLLQEEDR